MKNEDESLYSVDDPKNLAFDITEENFYLKKILTKLNEMNLEFPNKKYVSIFYERYVRKYETEVVCKNHNIKESELYNRLLEIVKFIGKEN